MEKGSFPDLVALPVTANATHGGVRSRSRRAGSARPRREGGDGRRKTHRGGPQGHRGGAGGGRAVRRDRPAAGTADVDRQPGGRPPRRAGRLPRGARRPGQRLAAAQPAAPARDATGRRHRGRSPSGHRCRPRLHGQVRGHDEHGRTAPHRRQGAGLCGDVPLRRTYRRGTRPTAGSQPGVGVQGRRLPRRARRPHTCARARPSTRPPCRRRRRLAPRLADQRTEERGVGRDRPGGCRPLRPRHPGRGTAGGDAAVLRRGPPGHDRPSGRRPRRRGDRAHRPPPRGPAPRRR